MIFAISGTILHTFALVGSISKTESQWDQAGYFIQIYCMRELPTLPGRERIC